MSIAVSNFLRVVTIFFGGAVVGGGTLILMERARFYSRILPELKSGRRAMYALMTVNFLVLGFFAFAIFSRWGETLTWRAPVAFAIFFFKGIFFDQLRRTGQEQERRLWHYRALVEDSSSTKA